MFSQLCKDDTPMVRRAAATHIGSLSKKLAKNNLTRDFIPLFTTLAADDQVLYLFNSLGFCSFINRFMLHFNC
jgi:hypothetical protein